MRAWSLITIDLNETPAKILEANQNMYAIIERNLQGEQDEDDSGSGGGGEEKRKKRKSDTSSSKGWGR